MVWKWKYIYCNAQFGFRNNRSTADCIILLHTIIQNVISHNSKLYCTFIDYEKAFDTVIHDAIWIKLVNSGLSCKMLTMIKSMYKNVTSCIKNADNMSYSELFDVSLGVKQGEPLSPLLFILFINDIKSCFDLTKLTPSDIECSIYMLLFADDIALFTTDPHCLQTQLDCINNYSKMWGLKEMIHIEMPKAAPKKSICHFHKLEMILKWNKQNTVRLPQKYHFY